MPDSPYSGKDMQAYIAALDELVGDRDPLEIMKTTPEALRVFFDATETNWSATATRSRS